jgi:hypothetical protein
MVCFESRDVGLVVRVRGEAVDPLGQIEAGLEMAGGMAVSLGFAAIEEKSIMARRRSVAARD